jgi:hypothetical protein
MATSPDKELDEVTIRKRREALMEAMRQIHPIETAQQALAAAAELAVPRTAGEHHHYLHLSELQLIQEREALAAVDEAIGALKRRRAEPHEPEIRRRKG